MRSLLILLLVCVSVFAKGQHDSTQQVKDTTKAKTPAPPPYLRNPFIPTFSIQLEDSSWYFNTKLNPKKPALILYFSPDCGHCQLETEEIMAKADALADLQIVMITSRPFEDMVNFIHHYKLDKFKNIVVGRDPGRTITRFYDVSHTPFSAFYNKKGKLVKVYKKGIDMPELIRLIN